MTFWIFVLAVLTILSYLSDVGIITFLQSVRIPVLNASLLSFILLLSMAGLLVRMLAMIKKGEKESLQKRVGELETELRELKKE